MFPSFDAGAAGSSALAMSPGALTAPVIGAPASGGSVKMKRLASKHERQARHQRPAHREKFMGLLE
jgi:hypothetical protein